MSSDEEEEQTVLKTFTRDNHPSFPSDHQTAKVLDSRKMLIIVLSLGVLLALLILRNNFYRRTRASIELIAAQLPPETDEVQQPTVSPQTHLQQQLISPLPAPTEPAFQSFIIPKNVWIYAQEGANEQIFVKKCLQNVRYYAGLSGFEVNLISQNTFQRWLPREKAQEVRAALEQLKQQGMDESQLSKVKQLLIRFTVLHLNGGILASKNIIFTENFTWIQHIAQNRYVNRGSPDVIPRYVAFFDINKGSKMEIVNKEGMHNDYEKYMIKFPGIEEDFMVAVAQGQFLEAVLKECLKILNNGAYLHSMNRLFHLQMGTISPNDLANNAFKIAAHIVLQVKQFEIGKEFSDESKVNRFAVDHYGLMTMNSRYFMNKVTNIFQDSFEEKIYNNLAFYSMEELEQTTGPLRYLSLLPTQSYIGHRLNQLTKEVPRLQVHPQSFIAKHILMGKEENAQFLQKEVEKPVTNTTGKRWDSLPKIVWLFWNTGISNASIGNRVCIENLKRSAEKSGFQVREVNNSNIEHYIGKELNQRFDNVIKNRKIPTFPQTKSNFVRKAIIHKYGGIYMDVSYIALESFDWILNIAQYPSQYIFNRYGELPKMLMFFHPHFGQPFSWEYDARGNTKRMDHVAYQNNLIIAEPNQQLLTQWIDQYALTITSDYSETKKRMVEYKVDWFSWTDYNNLYLTSMDSLKNVIGRRQNQLDAKTKDKDYQGPRSASEYYGIWSMSGYRGQQKIRIHTNFDNSYYMNPQSSNNVFLYRYSQEYTEGILGHANQLIKLYNWNIRHLTELIESDFQSGFTKEIHPESYCMKYLIAPIKQKLQKKVELIVIKDQ